METAQLSITTEQYERIQTAEAVAVSLYRNSGLLFSKVARIGTISECEDYVNTPALLIIYQGVEYIGSEVVLTKDLIPPKETITLNTEN
jgi:hypothetical protein